MPEKLHMVTKSDQYVLEKNDPDENGIRPRPPNVEMPERPISTAASPRRRCRAREVKDKPFFWPSA